MLNKSLAIACQEKRFLKAILGIDNFQIGEFVGNLKAFEVGGATCLDIGANTDLLQEVKKIVSIPICVSSISVSELEKCYYAGADVLELGNFDIFYSKNIHFTSQQIIATTKKLRERLPSACVCITIPHILSLNEQLLLAQELERLGVDMLQTEGSFSKLAKKSNLLNTFYNASATLSSTMVLSERIGIPIIASSGINPLTAPLAILSGASGVGIGSYFRDFSVPLDVSKEVSEVKYAMQANHVLSNHSQKHEFFRRKISNLNKVL
uniref:Uncharacterized protein ycf23 n=1 Tax=Dermonema virens TaxID=1077399 RepID=A0A1G4NRL7_9FLOR|nr:Hypothetical protein ycf23 [Dermonema virens]SCW21300.1 Hypothetical protein ycf23 [Dermonema virens]